MTESQTPAPATDAKGAQEPPAKTNDYESQHGADPVAGHTVMPDEERELGDGDSVR